MSTKTLNGKLPYIVASIILHAVAVWAVAFPLDTKLFSMAQRTPKEKLIFIDIIELPPGAGGIPGKPKSGVTRGADRSMTVEKETVPPSGAPRRARQALISPGNYKGKVLAEKKPSSGNKGTNAAGEASGKSSMSSPRQTNKGSVIIPGPEKKAGSKEGGGEGYTRQARLGTGGIALFPTGQRITELTREYEASTPVGEVGKILALNTTEVKYHAYLVNMERRIKRYWNYPVSAARRGEQGKLRIDFTIGRDGIVKDIKMIKSSNYPPLDDAAVTALRLASPFNPFPKNFTIKNVTIHASFEYELITMRGY